MTHCIVQNTNIVNKRNLSLKHRKTFSRIQDWCIANGVEKKPDELKINFKWKKINVSE